MARMPASHRPDAHSVERAARSESLRRRRPASSDRKRVRALVAIARRADFVAHEARILLSTNRATAVIDDLRQAIESLSSAQQALRICNGRGKC